MASSTNKLVSSVELSRPRKQRGWVEAIAETHPNGFLMLALKKNDINARLESYFVEKYGLIKAIDEDIDLSEVEIEA